MILYSNDCLPWQLGLGDSVDRNIPCQVSIASCRPRNVACGWWHTLLMIDKPVWLNLSIKHQGGFAQFWLIQWNVDMSKNHRACLLVCFVVYLSFSLFPQSVPAFHFSCFPFLDCSFGSNLEVWQVFLVWLLTKDNKSQDLTLFNCGCNLCALWAPLNGWDQLLFLFLDMNVWIIYFVPWNGWSFLLFRIVIPCWMFLSWPDYIK